MRQDIARPEPRPGVVFAGQRFAGLLLDRPLIMGIVNVTPDSFSDGGDHDDPSAAIAHGLHLAAEGADILDVGGESTRPGSDPVPPEREAARIAPVVEGLARAGHVVSIDTRRALVMQTALTAGARIVNDVTALTGDPDSLGVVAAARAPVVLMHMRGDPKTMQDTPRYDDVVGEVCAYLAGRIAACRTAGIPAEDIAIDPGIGFAKDDTHNLALLRHLDRLTELAPVLLGVSRKSFIGRLSRGEAPKRRLAGSLAAALSGVARGAAILRVHDVAETVQALRIWRAIEEAS